MKRRSSKRSSAAVAHPLTSLDFLTAELSWDEDTGNWVSFVRELDLSDFGKTQEQALDRTAAMILTYLNAMEQEGFPIPLPAERIQQIRTALA